MRLAVDCSLLARPQPTGVDRVQRALIDALEPAAAALGHELLLLAPATARPPLAVWRETGLVRELSRHRADVCLSPVAAVPLRAGCPVLATLHELPWLAGPAGRTGDRRLAHRLRVHLAARVAAAVICVSAETREQFLRRYPSSQAVVVPPGLASCWSPVAAADDDALAALDLRGRRPLLAVGRLRRKKNLLALLEAFARAAPPPRRLVLVGPDGDAAAALRERAARPDLAGRVQFAGFVPDATLAALYRASELVVCPSLFEGFGLPALEAMACGAPVLVAPGAVAREARGPALVAQGDDAASLTEALAAALADEPGRRRAAAAGPAHAAQFSAARAADRTLVVCERVAAGRVP